ncbi:MAG: DUF1830 domain-containing protein [Okeania sp. SIO3C4]|nr:DUF1830 domain-containing protein [Okeania sp. SIO3C4]
MAQILDPLPSNSSNQILCCYVNATSQIQIARISNIPNWYFERVVFPGQRLVFESVAGASMEIHTGMMASSILSDTVPCDRLQINEGPYSSISITEQGIPQLVSLPQRRKTPAKLAAVLSAVD